jgi:hypothetical protein
MTNNKYQNVLTPRKHLSSHYCFMLYHGSKYFAQVSVTISEMVQVRLRLILWVHCLQCEFGSDVQLIT